MRAFIVVLVSSAILTGCGGGAPSSPTSPASPAATALPAPPPGCEAWPATLADLFGRLSVVSNLCFLRESSPFASEYRPDGRRVIYRNPSPVGGEIGSIVHELCHAHQHRVILDANIPDIAVMDGGDWLQSNWATTLEGREYLEAAGYTHLGPSATCTRSPQPGCWAQNPAFAEMGFTLASYGNPMEDNAEFCQIWYNVGNLPIWSRAEVARIAPRRSAWAQKYLR